MTPALLFSHDSYVIGAHTHTPPPALPTRVDSAAGIAQVADLARAIWTEHYTPIIGADQVDYMLRTMQSPDAIATQIAEGCRYYILHREDQPAGYIALLPDHPPGAMHLSKFYVTRAARGRGLGRAALHFVESLCRAQGLSPIWLTVNRRNPSVTVYEKLGFRITRELVKDIGNGFVMDDFRMDKPVPLPQPTNTH